jgi:predicted small metal-binding protein
MQYSFTCPDPCGYEIKVEARTDNEAMSKIMTIGKIHAREAHPDMQAMTEQQRKEMLKASMKKFG